MKYITPIKTKLKNDIGSNNWNIKDKLSKKTAASGINVTDLRYVYIFKYRNENTKDQLDLYNNRVCYFH